MLSFIIDYQLCMCLCVSKRENERRVQALVYSLLLFDLKRVRVRVREKIIDIELFTVGSINQLSFISSI